jgi:hypothetical protein
MRFGKASRFPIYILTSVILQHYGQQEIIELFASLIPVAKSENVVEDDRPEVA